MGSATLCSSRWTQRRRRQFHCVQNRRKHRARLLTEKALRCRCPVRPGEEKVVHGSEAFPLTRQIESSKLMATQRQVAVSPLHIGARALQDRCQPLGLVTELILSLGAQRAEDAARLKQRGYGAARRFCEAVRPPRRYASRQRDRDNRMESAWRAWQRKPAALHRAA